MTRNKGHSKATTISTGIFPNRESKSLEIRRAFNQLIRNKGVGTIDGVDFDLRHDKFNIVTWTPFSILSSVLYLPGEDVEGVVENVNSIWFHWFGPYSATNPGLKDVSDQQQFYYVNPGDRIGIHEVVDIKPFDGFQYPDDEVVKELYLKIYRVDNSLQIMK